MNVVIISTYIIVDRGAAVSGGGTSDFAMALAGAALAGASDLVQVEGLGAELGRGDGGTQELDFEGVLGRRSVHTKQSERFS